MGTDIFKYNLPALETIIETGKQAFVDVGLALSVIKDKELWRKGYDSFEAYCSERWGWKKSYCYEIIASAEAVRELPEQVSGIVENPGQARELSKVPKEKRAKVLQAASDATDGKVTAKSIKAAAQSEQPSTVQSDPEPLPVADNQPESGQPDADQEREDQLRASYYTLHDIKLAIGTMLEEFKPGRDKKQLVELALWLKAQARQLETF